jgi:hypothetical protein
MVRCLTAFICAFIFLSFISGCAGTQTAVPADYEKNWKIKASGVHEDCFKLLPGQTVEYAFKSSRSLDFNLHCHLEGKVVNFVKKDGVMEDSGTFACKIEEYYCLMWTNPHPSSANVSYEFKILE